MKKITNYQKQKLKKYFGKNVDLNITWEDAELKIIEAEEILSKKEKKHIPNNLESVGWFDHWFKDE
jgi:hypothetical protein